MTSEFRNPANAYSEKVSNAGLWCFFFGFIYFAVKGVWTHAVASFVLAILTLGVSWLVYPFFAQKIVEQNYLRRGWVYVGSTDNGGNIPPPGLMQLPKKRHPVRNIVLGLLALFVASAVVSGIMSGINDDQSGKNKTDNPAPSDPKLSAKAATGADNHPPSPSQPKAKPQPIKVNQIVRAGHDHTVGCLAEGTLREVRQQLSNVIPPDGWEKNVASLGCYPTAADIHWRVVDLHGNIARLQLDADVPTRPVLYFVIADLVTEQGDPLRQ